MGSYRGIRAQSAMEYLLNYAWVLLILAIVFAALFALGVFGNPNPQFAQPGGCRVQRVNGPGSTPQGLTGTCIGQLPLSVAKFDGTTAYAVIPQQNFTTNRNLQSLGVWVYLNALPTGSYYAPVVAQQDPIYSSFHNLMGVDGTSIYVDTNGNVIYDLTTACPISCLLTQTLQAQVTDAVVPDRWYYIYTTAEVQVSGVANTVSICVASSPSSITCNTLTATTGLNSPSIDTAYYTVGSDLSGDYLSGYISNLQIYDSVLSPANANALYLEGIGGAPIDINQLVGWWPLNGNIDDYSGDGYSNTIAATSGNFAYSSTWYQTTKYKNP